MAASGSRAGLRPLPKYTSAESAIAKQTAFHGRLAVASLPRLVEIAAAPAGLLEIELQIERITGAPPRVKGAISGSVQLICQRCMRQFEYPLNLPVDVLLAHSEAEEARLSELGEVAIIEDDRLALHDLVEDELLLSLPVAPRCEAADCGPLSLQPQSVFDSGADI